MATSFRPPKQWVLQEEETITSFASWQSNIKYNLSLNNDFAAFIDPGFTWSKKSVANRGLAADGVVVDENLRKTAAQKNIQLERMLGIIAQFSPSLLRKEIIKKSLSLNWIWQRIRQHYGFRQSESNFLKLHQIKRSGDERFETLYQKIVAHIEDNLLTVESGILHDGSVLTADEEMSPTCERLAVYLWLVTIDERLPSYVSRVYAHDLQSKSLKDLQPQICQSMDSLLTELNAQEESQINYNKSFIRRKMKGRMYKQEEQSHPRGSSSNNSNKLKSCVLCKAAGRTYQGHDISGCWFLSKFDKMEMTQALQVQVDEYSDEEPSLKDTDIKAVSATLQEISPSLVQENTDTAAVSLRVQCDCSPFFFAFFKHHPCKIVIDTGATSSLISNSFAKRVGLKVKPTQQAARQLDKSSLKIIGETQFQVSFGDNKLLIDGLVNDSLDCDILAGVPFCRENNIDIHLSQEEISLNGRRIPYGSKPNSLQHEVFRTDSVILRNNSSKVIYPGEYIEIICDSLNGYEGEVAIEPRLDSPLQGTWPEPAISRVIQGMVRIPNDTDEPIHVSKCKHFAQIRRVTVPVVITEVAQPPSSQPSKRHLDKQGTTFSSTVSVDPDNLLTKEEKMEFITLNKSFDNTFRPNFGVYNDHSGPVGASLNLGPVKPPPTKPKLPFYNEANMKILQEEADKLEELGVLAKPEDVGVEVKFASPSFLVRKPDGSPRFVTAFNELGQYTKVLPTVANSCNDVLRKMSKWKYLIKTDLTKSFFQIPMSKSSIPYLGTITPFKGLRVYLRPAMGMPGSSECLNELISRIFGDCLQEGFMLILADDLYIGANSKSELKHMWQAVLRRCEENNLCLSPTKTVIAPKRTTVLGWIWESGTLSVSPHKISPLVSAEPPKTCTAMRSFIGAYKALSRCVPGYSSLVSPLENATKGLQGSNLISWSSELIQLFRNAQEALKATKVLTIPTSTDKLLMTVDASPVNDGISATLFVIRNDKRLLAECFSLKLKSHQTSWVPCELEALAISAGVKHFSPYVRESIHPLQILSDNKPCVQAYQRLLKGHFSASARLSTFLSCLSVHNITLSHIKGAVNTTSDYSSRHPQICNESACQICKFAYDTSNSVINSVSISDVLSGNAQMPFLSTQAWKVAQRECHDLRRAYAHLSAGTRPSRKAKNIRNLRKYLQIASISDTGLLVVRKADPYLHQRQLIVIPKDILPGILNALHLHFTHCSRGQLQKVFDRYFYAIGSESDIKNVVDGCVQCNSMRNVPKELFEQSSSPSPLTIGQQFAGDVIKRNLQSIFVLRDIHSSYTTASVIRDETAKSLRSAVSSNSSFLRAPSCTIRVDNAPGFSALRNDEILASHGITLEFGNVKNANKNPVADKCVKELELELLKVEPSGLAISEAVLHEALRSVNSRIRNRGLSAKEIVICRDQVSHELLNINDGVLSKQQESIRERNHPVSAKSKAGSSPLAVVADVRVGSLVYIKSEGNKFRPREQYIITKIADKQATIQKFNRGKFMSKTYSIPLDRLYPVAFIPDRSFTPFQRDRCSSNSSSESEVEESSNNVEENLDTNSEEAQETSDDEDAVASTNDSAGDNPDNIRRSHRPRQAPAWQRTGEWDMNSHE